MKIGIDLGGSHIAVGVVNDEAKLIAKEEENILFINKEQEETKELIRDKILSLINSLKQKLQMPFYIIDEIGIGVPGIVENNVIKKCEKYGIYNWDLAKELQEICHVNVKVTNDALESARAEVTYGNLKDTEKGIFLCIGTGIGGAIVGNWDCSNFQTLVYPSEFGHMVIEKNGRVCHCGRRGCFETYCSMRAFKNGIIEVLGLSENTSSEELLDIIKSDNDNERLNEYIDNYIEYLALGICNIINVVNPQKICIGGSFVFFEDILYKRLVEKMKEAKLQFEAPEIVLAMFQNDAGIIGAVL